MEGLKIAVDRRCCNEKNVSMDDFQEKIQNKLSEYKIKFTYADSPRDAYCTCGHTVISFVNASKEEIENVTNNINAIFKELIETSKLD